MTGWPHSKWWDYGRVPAFQAGGRETIERNPFDRVTFPKVGKPLIRPIAPEEFERLLLACTPPREMGPLADRAVARNRAILWLLYDTGIWLSELLGLKPETLTAGTASSS